MRYNNFWKIEDWKILDTQMYHFYDDDTTPFWAICVEIGTMTTVKKSAYGASLEHSPIIRWISSGEYERLKKNSGVVIGV